MKKNGFTLVEITVCVVLLVTIFLIVVPKVNTMINNKKKNAYNSLISAVKDAAQAYVYLNVNIVDDAIESQGYYEVSIRTLQENELLENKLENPLTGKNIPSTSIVKIIKNNEEYIYKFSLDYQYLLEHIIDLYSSEETRTSNGLKKDNTEDQNIRYYGSNPNNYVSFNNELWRIIGVFGNNVKLVRSEKLGNLSWDSSESSVNNGWGVNEWSQSALKNYLNTMYYGGTSVTCYNGQNKKEVTCPANKLDNTSKSLIDNYTWNTGAIEWGKASDTLAFYKDERGNLTGLINNDTVERTTTWPGYIGLPYATDWAYASGNDICEVNMHSKDSSNKYICLNDNWMSKGEEYWTLSPRASNVNGIWMVSNFVSVWANSASSPYALHPSIYLKNNVQIISGTGTSSDPYILKAGV